MKSRRAKKNFGKIFYLALLILIVAGLFFNFRSPIKGFFSEVLQAVSRPLWRSGHKAGESFSSLLAWFKSTRSLFDDNKALTEELRELEARLADRNIIWEENLKLKEILNRHPAEENFILGVILAKPNRSLYDTFIIDVGAQDAVLPGQRVFAYGDILIGELAEVYDKTSKVKLFSTPGEKTEVVLSIPPTPGVGASFTPGVGGAVTMTAIGRGGGNFEISVPRDLPIEIDQELGIAGIRPYALGKVKEIISDERDPIKKILIRGMVNLFELKFVQVEAR